MDKDERDKKERAQEERARRLAEQLRANLKRRKAQQRGRTAVSGRREGGAYEEQEGAGSSLPGKAPPKPPAEGES